MKQNKLTALLLVSVMANTAAWCYEQPMQIGVHAAEISASGVSADADAAFTTTSETMETTTAVTTVWTEETYETTTTVQTTETIPTDSFADAVSGLVWNACEDKELNTVNCQRTSHGHIVRFTIDGLGTEAAQLTGKISIPGYDFEELFYNLMISSNGYEVDYTFDETGALCFTLTRCSENDDSSVELYPAIFCGSGVPDDFDFVLSDTLCADASGQSAAVGISDDTVHVRFYTETTVPAETTVPPTTSSKPRETTTAAPDDDNFWETTTELVHVHTTDTAPQTTTELTATETFAESSTLENSTTSEETTISEETTTAEETTTTIEETTTISIEETTTFPTETTTAPSEDGSGESLPQTGCSPWFSLLIAGAALMTAAGGVAVKKSGILKNEDDDV